MMDQELSDDEIMMRIAAMGLTLDSGNLIDGPFIPDGTYRIYRGDAYMTVLASGQTLREAWEELPHYID